MNTPSKSAGFFVAVGEKGLRMISTDGVEWKHAQTGKDGEVYQSACFGKGRIVALATYGGKNLFASSADGQKWEVVEKQCPHDTIRTVAFGKDKFLAVGGTAGFGNYAEPVLIESDDGKTWGAFSQVSRQDAPPARLRQRPIRRRRRLRPPVRLHRRPGMEGRSEGRGRGHADRRCLRQGRVCRRRLARPANGQRRRAEMGKPADRRRGRAHQRRPLDRRAIRRGRPGSDLFFARRCRLETRSPTKTRPCGPLTEAGLFVGSHWKGRILTSKDAVIWQQVFKSEQHVEAIAFGNV